MVITQRYQVITATNVYRYDTLCRASEKSYALDMLNIPNAVYEFRHNSWCRI